MCDGKWPLCVFDPPLPPWGATSEYLLEIAIFEWWSHFGPNFQVKGASPQIIPRVIKLDDSYYKNIAISCYRSVAMHAFDRRVQTDQQTDRRTDCQTLIETPWLHCRSAIQIDWHYKNPPTIMKIHIHVRDPTVRLESMSSLFVSSQYMELQ